MTTPIRIAIVGMGKIARDEHLPSIEGNADFELVAAVSRHLGDAHGKPSFANIQELAASGLEIDAVALCTPPQVRRAIAAFAIEQNWHVFLEKPPGATLAEVIALRDQAAVQGVTLFASWHSRFANGVEPARAWLADQKILRATITWREDVRVWHPGQHWIWEAGGFGVFDPGINALSIATLILPHALLVERADLDIPSNLNAPIAARVDFRDTVGAPVTMDLDFRQEGPQSWDIAVETDRGTLVLSNGGSVLSITDASFPPPPQQDDLHGEYSGLYRRFAAIIHAGVSDVDVSPLRLVGDVFMRAKFRTVEPFIE